MSTTPPAASYTTLEPTKQPAFKEPHSLHDIDGELFVYGKWEYDLMDAPRDCMVKSCACVSIAQISARVTPGSYTAMLWKQFGFQGGVVAMLLGNVFLKYYLQAHLFSVNFTHVWIVVSVIAAFTFAVAIVWGVQLAKLRTTVREHFQIDGSTSDDCWAVCCCFSCAVAQMARQTKSSDFGSCDMEPRDALPAYQA